MRHHSPEKLGGILGGLRSACFLGFCYDKMVAEICRTTANAHKIRATRLTLSKLFSANAAAMTSFARRRKKISGKNRLSFDAGQLGEFLLERIENQVFLVAIRRMVKLCADFEAGDRLWRA